MNKLILASGSPRRKDLLRKAGFSFDIEPSNFEEDMTLDLPPDRLVQELSRGKAQDVTSKHLGESRVVLGSDSIVFFNNEVIGKPRDAGDAYRILAALSANEHSVHTGVTLINTLSGEEECYSVEVRVIFKELKPNDIDDYIETGDPMDKAGAYGLQIIERNFVKDVVGDMTCAIGLPMEETIKRLKHFGVVSETK